MTQRYLHLQLRFLTVWIEDVDFQMEVDTGVATSTMCGKDLQTIFVALLPNIKETFTNKRQETHVCIVYLFFFSSNPWVARNNTADVTLTVYCCP